MINSCFIDMKSIFAICINYLMQCGVKYLIIKKAIDDEYLF